MMKLNKKAVTVQGKAVILNKNHLDRIMANGSPSEIAALSFEKIRDWKITHRNKIPTSREPRPIYKHRELLSQFERVTMLAMFGYSGIRRGIDKKIYIGNEFNYCNFPEYVIFQLLARFTTWQVEILNEAIFSNSKYTLTPFQKIIEYSTLSRDRCEEMTRQELADGKKFANNKYAIFTEQRWIEVERIRSSVEKIRHEIGVCRDDMSHVDHYDLPL
jgi:hypothetical protein